MSRLACRTEYRFGSNASAVKPRLASALVLTCLCLVAFAPAAHASKYVDRIVAGNGTIGTAQGLFGVTGIEGAAINDPTVADGTIDPLGASTNGYVYVVDRSNNRVQVFGPDDQFKFTFGRGVQSGGDGAQVCDSSEAPCGAGIADDEEGEFNTPNGIAINQATGDVYVRDSTNRRVQQFTAAGQFTRTWGWDVTVGGGTGFEICSVGCKTGLSGAAGGQFTSVPTFSNTIAIDPAAPHHVFIGDGSNRRVQEFEADGDFVRLWGTDVITSGQPGDTGTGLEICTSTAVGVCKVGPEGGLLDAVIAVEVDGDDGSVYVSATTNVSNSAGLQRFDSDETTAAALLKPAISYTGLAQAINKNTTAKDLALDPASGNLFILVSNDNATDLLELSDPAGTPTHVDTHVSLSDGSFAINSVAPDPADGELYLGSSGTGRRLLVADNDGFTPAAMDVHVPVIAGQQVTLRGTVTPGGPLGVPTTYGFQVSKDGLSWTDVPATPTASLGDGNLAIEVEDDAGVLEPNRPYKVRLTTKKGYGNPTYPSTEVIDFHTEAAPPTAETIAPIGVAESSALLSALINPNNATTTYYFEWGSDNTYGNKFPMPPAPAGSDFGERLVTAHLEGLQPDATYHYRVVADNGFDADGDPVAPGMHEVRGADVAFTTRSALPAPDRRAFELVSPAGKWGGQGVGFWPSGLGHLGSSGVGAYKGERFAVQSQFGSTLDGDGGFSHSNDWVFAERAGDKLGWLSRSPLTHPNYKTNVGQGFGLRVATENLSKAYWAAPQSLAFFPEMLGGGDLGSDRPGWHEFAVGQMADWGSSAEPTRWELFGPADLSQVTNQSLFGAGTLFKPVFSPEGSVAVAQTALGDSDLPEVHGLAGPNDPTWPTPAIVPGAPAYGDLLEGGSIYAADLSEGLADSFASTGERELLNVCTGSGGERTEIPRVGAGDLLTQACPAGIGGRERLVSSRGAAFTPGAYIRRGVVSANGERTFFLSPDPRAPGVPNGVAASCSGSAASTLCPPQLYVSQRNPDGSRTTRWISKAATGLFGTQDATLTGAVRFEGAAEDGSVVYFRTNSPLTADDPNGLGAPVPGGVKTGTPGVSSWDLYAYEFPTNPSADLDEGTLTRISAGPNGTGDCNSPLPAEVNRDEDKLGALRALSNDGSRAYFTCQAPLPGVPAADNGTITSPGGTPTTADQTNLYLYDANPSAVDRWSFVSRVPRSIGGNLSDCASTGTERRSPFQGDTGEQPQITNNLRYSNCTSTSDDGTFLTFFTDGRLTADDPPDAVADIYAYDATREELTRVTAPQGGSGVGYPCIGDRVGTPGDESLLYSCRGDGGMDAQNGVTWDGPGVPNLGLVSKSPNGERVAFFNSASRLVPEDEDDGYDVYEWRQGKLSLITPGDPTSQDALYKGNSADGKNLYLVTREALTWQDTDAVADIYTARVGGGIPEPVAPPVCDVLVDACQGATSTAPVPGDTGSTSFTGEGNVPAPASNPRCPKGKVRKGKRCVPKKKPAKKKAAKKKGTKKRASNDWRADR